MDGGRTATEIRGPVKEKKKVNFRPSTHAETMYFHPSALLYLRRLHRSSYITYGAVHHPTYMNRSGAKTQLTFNASGANLSSFSWLQMLHTYSKGKLTRPPGGERRWYIDRHTRVSPSCCIAAVSFPSRKALALVDQVVQ